MSCGPAAIVDCSILEGRPIRAISYLAPIDDWDSGFCLFAGPPDEDPDTALVCIGCLIDDHPELAHALDYARRKGQWIAARTGSGRHEKTGTPLR